MKDTEYYKTGQLTQNALIAIELAQATRHCIAEARKEKYCRSPAVCLNCSSVLAFDKRQNKFCKSACSASFNNQKRKDSGWVRTVESIKLTSESLLLTNSKLTTAQKDDRARALVGKGCGPMRNPEVEFTCPHCSKMEMILFRKRNRKTCGSDDCKTLASTGSRSYINGRRKPVWFFNPNENKDVLLDSSWEVTVAELLNELNVKWTRPKFIKWIDSTGKTRRYFPDFYLSEHNVYLDPKNPFAMQQDAEKMTEISKIVTLVFGDLRLVMDYIKSLIAQSSN